MRLALILLLTTLACRHQESSKQPTTSEIEPSPETRMVNPVVEQSTVEGARPIVETERRPQDTASPDMLPATEENKPEPLTAAPETKHVVPPAATKVDPIGDPLSLPKPIAPNLFLSEEPIAIEIQMPDWSSFAEAEPKGGICNWDFSGSRYEWKQVATIRVSGHEFAKIGIKKRSWCGSYSNTKPSFSLKIDKFGPENKRLAKDSIGMNDLVLNNSLQDGSYLRQCFAYELFRKYQLAAPACNFATVSVNGKKLGVYVLVENLKGDFLERNFGKPGGNLYEFAGEYFQDWALNRFLANLESLSGDKSLADIKKIISAVEKAESGNPDGLAEAINFDYMLRFWAMEIVLLHWDGLMNANNNGYVYFPQNAKMVAIPWGTDQILNTVDERSRSIFQKNNVAEEFIKSPGIKSKLVDHVQRIMKQQWDEDLLESMVLANAAKIQPHISDSELPYWKRHVADFLDRMRSRRKQLESFLPFQADAPAGLE